MEKYLVTCWDPSEIYLSQPVNTLVKAGGVQAAIDLVKDASDDGDAYQWMATKMADLLEPKVVPAGKRVEVVTRNGYWEGFSDKLEHEVYVYDEETYQDLDSNMERDLKADGVRIVIVKLQEKY